MTTSHHAGRREGPPADGLRCAGEHLVSNELQRHLTKRLRRTLMSGGAAEERRSVELDGGLTAGEVAHSKLKEALGRRSGLAGLACIGS